MADTPWLGDACSLVDAFRAKELSPLEALDASLAAIERSKLNAFSYVAADEARAAAQKADVSLPFGGVPMAIKELERVKGWPYTEASLLFKDEVAEVDGTQVARVRDAGGVLVGLTTASEIGFVNYTSTKLNGTRGTSSARRADRPADRRRPWPAAWYRSPAVATAVVPSGSRPGTPGSSASRRPTAAFHAAPSPRSSR